MTWTGSRAGLSPSLTYYERTISPLPCTQMGNKCPYHKHSACQHICILRLSHCLTQDAPTAIMHKAPILNAVLSEALPVGDGELRMCGQGDRGTCTVSVQRRDLLRSLHNQISSSAHSGVVRRHLELLDTWFFC